MFGERKPKVWIPALVVAAMLAIAVGAAADFEPESRAWNGLAELISVGREAGIEVLAPAQIELAALRPSDGLLLLYPADAPPRPDLVAFMREGGRLGVADDFGASDALLEVFRIHRGDAPAPQRALRLRGNHNVLVAAPTSRHPLSQGVLALVVNHPQVLDHEELEPIFSLDGPRSTIVLAGAVGSGRLVAIGDSSVLINNMLEFEGNRTFADNLLRYLARDGRLFIASAETRIVAGYGGVRASPLAALSQRLERLATQRLPPRTVGLLTLGVAALLLVWAATSLPQRSTYVRAVTLRAPEVVAGFAGRIDFFAAGGRNLLSPLMSYKAEFETELVARLKLHGQPQLRDVAAGLRSAGVPEAIVDDAGELLRELERLKLAQERPSDPPTVRRRKFQAMIARGERILAAIGKATDTVPPRDAR